MNPLLTEAFRSLDETGEIPPRIEQQLEAAGFPVAAVLAAHQALTETYED